MNVTYYLCIFWTEISIVIGFLEILLVAGFFLGKGRRSKTLARSAVVRTKASASAWRHSSLSGKSGMSEIFERYSEGGCIILEVASSLLDGVVA
jgi:hypothetical protein